MALLPRHLDGRCGQQSSSSGAAAGTNWHPQHPPRADGGGDPHAGTQRAPRDGAAGAAESRIGLVLAAANGA